MKKTLLILNLLIATFLSGSIVYAQEQIINKSTLSNDIVRQKIAFLDSVRKANKFEQQTQQQDNGYYKSLLEQGYTRQHIDSLHKAADPGFVLPAWYPPTNEFGMPSLYQKHNSYNNQQNNINGKTNPIPLAGGPPSQPEQDCINGIPVCQSTYTQKKSYSGYGNVQEVYNTCLLAKEQCSVWYIFTVQTPVASPNTFGFTINTTHDYDYALYDLTAIGGCSNVPTSKPVRCNFSVTAGNTGLTVPPAPASTYNTIISYAFNQSPFEDGI